MRNGKGDRIGERDTGAPFFAIDFFADLINISVASRSASLSSRTAVASLVDGDAATFMVGEAGATSSKFNPIPR